MLTIGEKLWNGATVTPYLASAYNSLQERINARLAEGKPAPENWLNAAHKLIAEAV